MEETAIYHLWSREPWIADTTGTCQTVLKNGLSLGAEVWLLS